MSRQRATTSRGAQETGLARALWMSVEQAAEMLSMSSEALRRALERRARKAPDGGVEVSWDGVHARKLGRLWRVSLSDRWMNGAAEVTQSQEKNRP